MSDLALFQVGQSSLTLIRAQHGPHVKAHVFIVADWLGEPANPQLLQMNNVLLDLDWLGEPGNPQPLPRNNVLFDLDWLSEPVWICIMIHLMWEYICKYIG